MAAPSGPTNLCYCVRYADAPAAIEWLSRAFGFEARLVVPGETEREVAHAQLVFGNSMLMIGSSGGHGDFDETQTSPAAAGGRVTASAYVLVEDVDAHYARAVAAGARVVTPPEDQPYGGRLYVCADPEGHIWSFGSYDPWVG